MKNAIRNAKVQRNFQEVQTSHCLKPLLYAAANT